MKGLSSLIDVFTFRKPEAIIIAFRKSYVLLADCLF